MGIRWIALLALGSCLVSQPAPATCGPDNFQSGAQSATQRLKGNPQLTTWNGKAVTRPDLDEVFPPEAGSYAAGSGAEYRVYRD
jgi:hypothetical protein